MDWRKSARFTRAMLAAAFAAFVGNAHALTAGQNYTVTIGKINSNGTETTLSTSAPVTADADGKIAFSLASVPDNTTCNFMTIVIKDSNGTVARNGIAPCAAAGTTLPLGVSPVTDKQTEALKAGFAAAGTDDPILAVFGLIIVRTTGITSAELAEMATIARRGINDPNGFVDHLKTTRGVTDAQLLAYRNSIVAQLADANTGYSKLVKDSVDATTSATESGKRGEAAGMLMDILVKAASDAGFQQDYVIEAFNSMGSVAVPLINGSAVLSPTTKAGVQSSVGGGIQKIREKRVVEKYTRALTTLGATGNDVTQFQTAATTLTDAMRAAFSTFEQTAFQTGSEDANTINNAQTALNTAMNTAFNNFIAGVAVDDPRITTLIGHICQSIPNAPANCIPANFFKFYKPDGSQVNWPVNMVVLTDWVATNKLAGGALTYSRDGGQDPNAAVNSAFMPWMGQCSVAGRFNKVACETNPGAGVWTAGRTCFGTVAAAGEVTTCRNFPADYANLMAIQEDINIRQMSRWAAVQAANNDNGTEETAEQDFTNGLYTKLTGLIGGTTDGAAAITGQQKKAIVTLMSPPQM